MASIQKQTSSLRPVPAFKPSRVSESIWRVTMMKTEGVCNCSQYSDFET